MPHPSSFGFDSSCGILSVVAALNVVMVVVDALVPVVFIVITSEEVDSGASACGFVVPDSVISSSVGSTDFGDKSSIALVPRSVMLLSCPRDKFSSVEVSCWVVSVSCLGVLLISPIATDSHVEESI